MSLADELLQGNARYLEHHDAALNTAPAAPAKRLAIVACMDTRHVVEDVLGLRPGDAKIIRTAGAVVDDGAMRSLLVAIHALGVQRIAVMGHSRCGMNAIGDGSTVVEDGIRAATGHDVEDGFREWLQGFTDPAQNVRDGVAKIRDHPFVPDVEVVGLLYDNDSGRVERV